MEQLTELITGTEKKLLVFPDVQQLRKPRNRKASILRLMLFLAGMALALFLLIKLTLPLTLLSASGMFVYASIVVLVVFLGILLMRYCIVLVTSFLHNAKHTVEEKEALSPFVSIIMPVYNEGKVLKDAVSSLLELNYANYEIIIVNDGSTDDTQEVGETIVGNQDGAYGPVKVSLINKRNGGKATALNYGIQLSDAEFVMCVDGDSYLSPDTLKNCMRHFCDPQIGAVAGNVKVLNREKMLTKLQALEYIEGLNIIRSSQSYMSMVNIIPGPIGVFRKKAIMEVGWYSSDTFAEDADLTLKLRVGGWKIYYEQDAISYTEVPGSIYQLLKQRYRWTRGFLQSIRKHKHLLYNPSAGIVNTLVLWSMFYEAIIWPTMNIFANLFFIVVAMFYGMSHLIPLWWVSIMLLDVMAALYSVAVDKEEIRLVPYAILYRLFFILVIDITKAAATVEEVMGMRMTWGKLERVGVQTQYSSN